MKRQEDMSLEEIAAALYAAARTWRAIAGILGGAFVIMSVFSFLHLRDAERLRDQNAALLSAARGRVAECRPGRLP